MCRLSLRHQNPVLGLCYTGYNTQGDEIPKLGFLVYNCGSYPAGCFISVDGASMTIAEAFAFLEGVEVLTFFRSLWLMNRSIVRSISWLVGSLIG